MLSCAPPAPHRATVARALSPVTALPRSLRRLHAAMIGEPARRLRATVARIRRDGFPRPRLVWEYRPRPAAASAAPGADRAARPARHPAQAMDAQAGQGGAAPASPAPRHDLGSRLWGEGFMLPGGEAEVLRLAGLLPLSPATTLLLVGRDAGGAAEVIARTRGAWVASHLPDPEMARQARQHLRRIGRKATVEAWDPATLPNVRPAFHHHAMALEALRTAADPRGLLQAMVAALKPGGQLVLTEVVAARPEACPARWLALEGRTGPPPTAATLEAWLRDLGFILHVSQDLSDRHAAAVVEGWSQLLGEVARGPERRDRDFAAALVTEAEAWLLRHRLIGAGILRLRRWHASLAGPG